MPVPPPIRVVHGVVSIVVACATLMSLTATYAAAQAARDSAAGLCTVEQFHRALASGDSIAALALLAPDVAILESGGSETLPDYREHHIPADIAYARAVRAVRGPAHVVIVGDAAWVSSTSSTQGTFKERAINSVGAELIVLSRVGGEWRIRAIRWSSRAKRS